MPLPLKIDDALLPNVYMPPFRSSDGNYYAVSKPQSLNELAMFKATDPYVSYSEVDAANNPVNSIGTRAVFLRQIADVIHISSMDGDSLVLYHTFDMSSDAWGVTNETIESFADPATFEWTGLDVRSDGDVVAVYTGATEGVHGGEKERVYANVRVSGTWGGPIALDAGGDVHYMNPTIVKDPLTDDMHIFFQRETSTAADPPTTASDIQARTMEPVSNGLSAVDTDTIDTNLTVQGMMNAVAWDDGGTVRLLWHGVRENSGADDRIYMPATVDGSNDIVLGTAASDSATPPHTPAVSGIPFTSIAVDDWGIVHQLYVADADRDIYYTKSDDNGATWDTPILQYASITSSYVNANIFLSKAAIVLGFTVSEAGNNDLIYNEKELYPFEPLFDKTLLTHRRSLR